MPSGRTSMLELPANVLLATHPACSERQHHQPCRRSHERKLGDQTKDDADKEPREERSCGRSQTSLYNETRTHLALEGCARFAPSSANRCGQVTCHPGRTSSPLPQDLGFSRLDFPKTAREQGRVSSVTKISRNNAVEPMPSLDGRQLQDSHTHYRGDPPCQPFRGLHGCYQTGARQCLDSRTTTK